MIVPSCCNEYTNWPPSTDAGCIWRSGDIMITDSVIPPLRLAPHITPQSLSSVVALPESECYTLCNTIVSRFVRSRQFSTSPVNHASYHKMPLSRKVFQTFNIHQVCYPSALRAIMPKSVRSASQCYVNRDGNVSNQFAKLVPVLHTVCVVAGTYYLFTIPIHQRLEQILQRH